MIIPLYDTRSLSLSPVPHSIFPLSHLFLHSFVPWLPTAQFSLSLIFFFSRMDFPGTCTKNKTVSYMMDKRDRNRVCIHYSASSYPYMRLKSPRVIIIMCSYTCLVAQLRTLNKCSTRV